MTPVPFTPERLEKVAEGYEREAAYIARKRPDPFVVGEADGLAETAAMLRQAAAQARELAEVRKAITMARTWLEDIIASATPAPPGGQQVGPPRYSMTISTRKELQRVVDAIDTRLHETRTP